MFVRQRRRKYECIDECELRDLWHDQWKQILWLRDWILCLKSYAQNDRMNNFAIADLLRIEQKNF